MDSPLTQRKTLQPQILAAPDFNTDEVVIHAASLLRDSAHSLEAPVLAYAQEHGIALLPSAHVETLDGQGLMGRVNGKVSVLGKAALMARAGIDIASLHAQAQALQETGNEVYFVSIGDHLAGLIAARPSVQA